MFCTTDTRGVVIIIIIIMIIMIIIIITIIIIIIIIFMYVIKPGQADFQFSVKVTIPGKPGASTGGG